MQQRVILRRRKTVVGGKCALPSALLVYVIIYVLYYSAYTCVDKKTKPDNFYLEYWVLFRTDEIL